MKEPTKRHSQYDNVFFFLVFWRWFPSNNFLITGCRENANKKDNVCLVYYCLLSEHRNCTVENPGDLHIGYILYPSVSDVCGVFGNGFLVTW